MYLSWICLSPRPWKNWVDFSVCRFHSTMWVYKFKNFFEKIKLLQFWLIDDLFVIDNLFYYLILSALWDFLSGTPAVYDTDVFLSVLRLVPHRLRPWSSLKQFRVGTVRLSDPIMTNQRAFAELKSNVFLGSTLILT